MIESRCDTKRNGIKIVLFRRNYVDKNMWTCRVDS